MPAYKKVVFIILQQRFLNFIELRVLFQILLYKIQFRWFLSNSRVFANASFACAISTSPKFPRPIR